MPSDAVAGIDESVRANNTTFCGRWRRRLMVSPPVSSALCEHDPLGASV
jgi:hypothetical protein